MAFLRKSRTSAEPTPELVAVEESVTVAAGQERKGRPTPKRRDSSVRPTGPVAKAPQTRKEAVAYQKAKRASAGKMTSAERKEVRAKQMAALRAGNPDALPARDRGPTKALARDWVDSRRMMSNYMFLLLPLIIIGTAIPTLTFLPFISLMFLAVIVLEGYFNGRHVRRLARARFGAVKEGTAKLGFYCASRASMPRRWRLPAPQVEIGDAV